MNGPVRSVYLIKNCPLCGSVETKPILSEQCSFPSHAHPEVFAFHQCWSHLLQCQKCQFAFTQETPLSPSFFDNRYDNKNFDPSYEVDSNRKELVLDEVFHLISQHQTDPGTLLDVGSFAGKLLKYAQNLGHSPTGVEVNPKLAQYSRDVLGFDVIQGKVQEVDIPSNSYQIITIIDVLEHLVGPKTILEKLSSALEPGGLLIIKVPNYNMQIVKQAIAKKLKISNAGIFGGYGHINHFNIDSLQAIIQTLGLELVHTKIARSEHWPDTTFSYRMKNIMRDFYWKIANLIIKLTGINIGMNNLYIIRKPK